MMKKLLFFVLCIFSLSQSIDAQDITKGKIEFKKSLKIDTEIFQKQIVAMLDTMIAHEKPFAKMSDATEEQKYSMRQLMLDNLKNELLGSKNEEAKCSYKITFDGTKEALVEKFDKTNKKLKHTKHLANGQIITYDFWSKKGKLSEHERTMRDDNKDKYTITEDRADTKIIAGIECYKIRIEEKMEDDKAEDSEILAAANIKSISEMYVTNQIKLFPGVMTDSMYPQDGFFPLEMIRYINVLDSVKEVTTVTNFK